jgi:Predicted dehydrogenases and related proteins
MMTARKPRFILLGTGGFGSFWCKNYLPNIIGENGIAELVAAVDINPEAHLHAIQYLGLDPVRCYTDARMALQKNDCDFLAIVLPAHLHEYAVDLALEYDKHILMEKPIADTMEASARIYRKVTQAGKKMAITSSHRYDQDKQTLQRMIHSGAYGLPHYLVGRFTCNNRASVNDTSAYAHHHFLISSAVHHFDIIRSLAGSNAKKVYTQSWNPAWAPFKEHSTALINIEMENGVRAIFEGSKSNATQLNGWGNDYFRAECEFATLELDHRKITVRSDLGFPYPQKSEVPLLEQSSWTHPWLIKQFVEWIQGGATPPNNIDDHIQCTALQFAAIDSGLTGNVVDVRQFLEQHLSEIDS